MNNKLIIWLISVFQDSCTNKRVPRIMSNSNILANHLNVSGPRDLIVRVRLKSYTQVHICKKITITLNYQHTSTTYHFEQNLILLG